MVAVGISPVGEESDNSTVAVGISPVGEESDNSTV